MGGKNITVTGVPGIGSNSPFAESAQNSLTNHLLIAMPSLSDPNFAQTVSLICEHTEKGALGIVLNKPLSEFNMTSFYSFRHNFVGKYASVL